MSGGGPGNRCQDIVDEVMRRITEQSARRVVIAARWSGHGWPAIEPNVVAAIVELRKRGVTRIDMVGQLPEWHQTLPATLFSAYQIDKKFHQRMALGLSEGGVELDVALRRFANEQGINFISVRDILCNRQGCLTMIGGRLDALTAFDRAHLTVPASEFVVARFPP
jgi:2,4-dienoyl-CoA reductase-like NADH-dependent reductase (Old Yellow Enzyme family)